jgi:hypothetical protein
MRESRDFRNPLFRMELRGTFALGKMILYFCAGASLYVVGGGGGGISGGSAVFEAALWGPAYAVFEVPLSTSSVAKRSIAIATVAANLIFMVILTDVVLGG